MVVVLHWLAERQLKETFDYYSEVAGRRTAVKIISTIRNHIKSLGPMPFKAPIELSLEGEPEKYRSLVVLRRYKAIYFVEDEKVIVVDIWDCRQDPERLKTRVTEMAEV